MLTGDALHAELLARLGARQPSKAELPLCAPVVHEGGVIEWSPSYLGSTFLRVLGARVLSSGLGRDASSEQRGALARWIAAIDPGELELVSEERPVRFFEGQGFAQCGGHAIVHPSLVGTGPSQLTTELLAGRTYRLAAVHRSEIALDMDATWAKAQLIDLRGGPERAPCSAFRGARTKRDAKKPAPLKPARPQGLEGWVSVVMTGDTVTLENAWRHRLRLARPTASWLDADVSRAFVGLDDARAIARAFVDHDVILREPEPPDVLEPARLYDQLEACARDVVDGVEPVDVLERSTNGLVARLVVRREGEVLRVTYERLDPRLGEAHIRPLLEGPYLHALTRHHDRGKASTIVLEPETGAGPRFEYPYPRGGPA